MPCSPAPCWGCHALTIKALETHEGCKGITRLMFHTPSSHSSLRFTERRVGEGGAKAGGCPASGSAAAHSPLSV